jgi:lysophospholipase L1-like esterase
LSNDNSINKEKIETLKNDLIGYNESEDLIWGSDFWNAVHVNQGGYISSDDGVSIISDNRYGYTDYIDISEYMLIKLLHNVSESVTHRIYVYDENKTYLSKTEVFSPTTDNPFIFTGYKHAKYMRFSITLSESDTYGLLAVNRIVYGGENIKSINRSMLASAKSLVNGKIISPNIINWDGMLTGTFVNSSNVETYFKEGLETGFVDVSDFNSIKIYLNPDLTRGRAVKFYDSSDNIVRYISLSATSEIAIPENAVKMRMTIFGMTNDGYSDIPYIKFYGIYGSMDAFVSQPYQGKKISILGDSISTFSGWLYPSENVPFYTGNNAGVSAVSDTWWYKLITALGATLEKNNSWSGSAVSNCRGSYPKSGIQRCTNLGNPDVIIVRMGTNDFYFGAELGTYDGTTAIPTGETTFSDAFAKMLDMIMTTYKTAEIWVCTMTQFERIGNVGYPETNSHGETIAEWNERIRKIARALGAKILDDAMCGMTYQNIGVYTSDQPYEQTGNGLHPNAAGMSLIANNCIRTMDASTRIRY